MSNNSKLLTPDFARRVTGFTVHAMDSKTGEQSKHTITERMVSDYIAMAAEESAKKSETFLVTLCSQYANNVMFLTGEEWRQQQAMWKPEFVKVKELDCDVKKMRVGDSVYKLTFYSAYSVENEEVEDPATKLLAYLVAGVVFPDNTGVLMYAKFDRIGSA